MRVENLSVATESGTEIWSATIVWEELARAPDRLVLKLPLREGDAAPSADAFLCAAFPFAVLHRERRLRIEGAPCPMLVEGLHTVHAWWAHWRLVAAPMPVIETQRRAPAPLGPRRMATAFLSGGVDSLHMLRCNRRLYEPGEPGFIADAILVHGFDIGKKKKRGDERAYFDAAVARLQPIASELGLRLVTCSTNLRHLPAPAGAWLYQFHGSALAAMGHAATLAPAFLFLAGTYDVANMSHWGSHPAVDVNYSSQRVTFIHDGTRFSRLDKVRDLADWPAALDNMRVCTANPPDRLNCGECEKCIRTRLELLAVGRDETGAFGDVLVPVDLVERVIEIGNAYQASCFADVVAPLKNRGLDALATAVERKLALFSPSPARGRG